MRGVTNAAPASGLKVIAKGTVGPMPETGSVTFDSPAVLAYIAVWSGSDDVGYYFTDYQTEIEQNRTVTHVGWVYPGSPPIGGFSLSADGKTLSYSSIGMWYTTYLALG